jgi:hypothetical protein
VQGASFAVTRILIAFTMGLLMGWAPVRYTELPSLNFVLFG